MLKKGKGSSRPNPFYLFAQDIFNQQGRNCKSFQHAFEIAGPLWNKMSAEQRKPYADKAKACRGADRYTSDGIPVDDLLDKEKQKNQAMIRERDEINNIISVASRRGNEVLAKETFFVVHCNIFCYHPTSDKYYPAEICIVKFSLKDGVKQENVYHSFIKPGNLPLGYKFEAKQHADETHHIPIPLEGDDQEQIYFEMIAFLNAKKSPGTKRMPILYAAKPVISSISNVLNSWAQDYEDISDLFNVYNLSDMFLALKNNAAGETVWPTVTYSDRVLETDVYAYVPDIACKLHQTVSNPVYCSQSIAIRTAYIICDNCCNDLNIQLVPGRHIPLYLEASQDSSANSSGEQQETPETKEENEATTSHVDSDTSDDAVSDAWDVSSVGSSSTLASNFDNEFPSLGSSRNKPFKSNFSQEFSAPLTYSRVASVPVPAGLETAMENLSVSQGSSRGRGFRRKMNAPPVPGPEPKNDGNDVFRPPSVSRGRGFALRRQH